MEHKSKLSHVDAAGNPKMVNVSGKAVTHRTAWAQALLEVGADILAQLHDNEIHTKKGPVFQTAIIAGVMGAKKTGELIPFCHPLGLEDCQIDIRVEDKLVVIDCKTSLHAKTGVEMEALTGASVAALTVYDMCKALSHDIVIKETRLMEKTGGKQDFKRTD